MHEVIVRPFEMSDAEDVKALRLKSLLSEPQAFRSSYQAEKKRSPGEWHERFMRTQGEMPSELIFIALIDGKKVGVLRAIKKPETWKISAVYVDVDFRGQGIGSKLLSGILKTIEQRNDGVDVKLEVNAEQEPAIRLYKKFGFKTIGNDTMVLGDGLPHKKLHMRLQN